jgi:hypothetical protein
MRSRNAGEPAIVDGEAVVLDCILSEKMAPSGFRGGRGPGLWSHGSAGFGSGGRLKD